MQQHSETTDMNEVPQQPRASRSWWPLLVLILAFGLFAVSRNQPASDSQDSVAIGKSAPQLELVRLSQDPSEMSIEGLPAGKVTLIHLWGTWCGPCTMEYPHLSEMVQEFASNDNFAFISISCEAGSSETIESLAQRTQNFLDSIDADTDVFADPRGMSRENVAKSLGKPHMYFPTSVLVDQQGTIRGVWEGFSPNGVDQMKAKIEELL
ncbi:hypothetical protein GCM10023156_39000 [Novipirellula rosea]|uniref:Thioredoxin domain-containing protein n=2 Tax=Novipirellula rosea TaxID=1031540 RepID=A0ABP8N0Y6_9BACT